MFQKEQRRLTLKGPLQMNWGADIYLDKIKYLRGFFPPNGFFKLRQGASISPNVGLSVCLSVCLSVEKNRKSKKSKNQNSLIIFDYLINFGASLRTWSMEGGWGGGWEGDFR